MDFKKTVREKINEMNQEESEVIEEQDGESEESEDVIIDLATNDYKDIEDQMQGVELLRGMAAADNEVANEFMSKLSDAFTDIADEMDIEIG